MYVEQKVEKQLNEKTTVFATNRALKHFHHFLLVIIYYKGIAGLFALQ